MAGSSFSLADLEIKSGRADNGHQVIFEEENIRDIAIVGMACRFPKAGNLIGFWENLKNGRDCIGEFPESRKKDVIDYFKYMGVDLKSSGFLKAAYLEEIDKFDYNLFRLSPREAALMNPTQRLFLEIAWETIEDAGYSAGDLAGSNTGVYVGYIGDLDGYKYKQMITDINSADTAIAVPGNLSSIIPGRISYLLDLKGPTMLVDTACSSSLVAVHLACNAIRSGECKMAIAGGVRINLFPVKTSEKIGIESSDYRTHSFDDSSDGTGTGEGVAAVMLKPLSAAVRNMDNIYAVIKGTAINQDGSSAGITAPNASAQAEVIIKAWKDADINPETISYIEAHGTGTKLGDPVEVEGIRAAFNRYTGRKQFCAIGSVKSNVGHLYDSAGIISLVKSALMLKHKMLVPSINFEKPNSRIIFENTPVYVNTKLKPWIFGPEVLRCGVSSFGFSGTNCHLVLEEAPKNTEYLRKNRQGPELLVLSAKTSSSLAGLIRKYADYLEEKSSADLKDITYTANTGRSSHGFRMAMVIKDREDLKAKINVLAKAPVNSGSEGVFFNNGLPGQPDDVQQINDSAAELVRQFVESGKTDESALEEIGRLFLAGGEINWKKLYKNDGRKRTSVPTYSFDKKRCWIKIPESGSMQGRRDLSRACEPAASGSDNVSLSGRDSGIYSATEQAVASVWSHELGYDTINIKDSFQQMGGDSILAAKTAHNLCEVLKKKISAADVLKYPNAAEFAAYIDGYCVSDEGEAPVAGIQKAGGVYPLSSAQKRLFILNELLAGGLQYNLPYSVEVEGNFDTSRVREVFNRLIELHESFRTSFHMADGNPVQKIHDRAEIELQCFNEDDGSPDEIKKRFIRPFDLGTAPLLRAGLIRRKNGKSIMLVDMHHIVSDGTSMGVLLRDFAAICGNKTLPEKKYHYKEFAAWQNRADEGGRLIKQEKYWLEVFRSEVQALNLIPDSIAEEEVASEGGKIEFEIDSVLAAGLRSLASRHGATLYMAMLSAYYILLSKYTGNEDITVGTPTAGRPRKEFADIIGMFVNTLAMRNYPAGSLTFLQFLLAVKENTLNAFANQDFQFDDLIGKLGIKREMNGNPLFNTMFVMQNMPLPEIEIDGLKFGKFRPENSAPAFDLLMEVFEGNVLRIEMQYRAGKFRESTMKRMAGHYKNILNEIICRPGVTLAEINMMSQAEEHEILVDFNNTKAKYPETKTAHELFEEQVKRTPDKAALVFEGEKLTYDGLNKKSNQLARLLRDRGVKAETIVAVMAEQSLEMIVAIMAVLKAGGAYLPIDPKYPDDRIKYMLKDSKAVLLLTQEKLALKYRQQQDVVLMDAELLYTGEDSNLEKSGKFSDLAYVIYTSGSTGEPKGVLIEHKSLVNLVCWHLKQYSVTCADNSTKYAGFGFDASVWEIFPYLLSGGTLHIISDDLKLDMNRLGGYFEKNDITISFLPTQVCEQFFQVENKTLTRVLTGGDKLKKFKKTRYCLYNNYGPTENTVVSTVFQVCEFKNNIPIGKPVQNTRVVITNLKNDKLQPVGVPGEMCISGAGLARGYLNREELTSEKFIKNNFYPGEYMYKTGDMARWLPDGNIEFLGRLDSQVKIRGFRIELGEIETCLLKNGLIKEAIVVDREDSAGGKYLCAYVTAETEIDVNILKEKLAVYLPDYMVPSFIIRIPRIPLNANGKTDKKALPEPSPNMLAINNFVPPETKTEIEVARVWADVLGFVKIGVTDNFFEIGGNSLKAIQVVSKLSENYAMTINDFFKHQTIKDQSGIISGNNNCLKSRIETAKQLFASREDEINPEIFFARDIEEYRNATKKYADFDLASRRNYRGILLTGGTGYLGIHVLKELLQKTNSDIYLIIRGNDGKNAEERLKNKLDFYFKSENLYERFNNRIFVKKGDISEKKFQMEFHEYELIADNTDCIINCAANVRHYGNSRDFSGINIAGVERLVEFAQSEIKKDIHHISTMSAGSGKVEGKKHVLFSENDCDVGQVSDNQYIHTKLMAEKIIVSAREKGIQAGIYRVGNLVFESVKGKFQENIEENGFYGLIKSFIGLGLIPAYEGWKLEFSFIDRVSEALVLLMHAEKIKNETFHVYNNNTLAPSEFSVHMRSAGYEVDDVDIADFLDLLYIYRNKTDLKQHVEKFLLHSRILESLDESKFYTLSEKTNIILGKLGFIWTEVTKEQTGKMLEYCAETGFFDRMQQRAGLHSGK